jgi:hypothetical protein
MQCILYEKESSMKMYSLCKYNIVTNLMRVVTSKQELYPLKRIFFHKKHENQPPNQKVVLLVEPFFVTGSKLQLF